MNILLLGATGMLGQALLREAAARGIRMTGVARRGAHRCFDLRDDDALTKAVQSQRPDVIVNAAAVTSVNACEEDPSLCYLVNARVPSIVADLCIAGGIYLVQVSTDHYFSGDGAAKHAEDAPVRLFNEYARSKYAAERFALTCPAALVVRTNVIGFRHWDNQPTFVEWVISCLTNSVPMTLFDDFYVSSIDVRHFSSALFDLLKARPSNILNLASREVFSKKAFVEMLAHRCGFSLSSTKTGSVRDLAGARRAESAGLDVAQAEAMLGYPLPDLGQVVTNIATEYRERRQCTTRA